MMYLMIHAIRVLTLCASGANLNSRQAGPKGVIQEWDGFCETDVKNTAAMAARYTCIFCPWITSVI